MKKMFVFPIVLLLTQYAIATPISAIMNFESTAITSEGVKKQTQFQERLIRDNNIIWTQRIIPASAPHHQQTKNEHDDEHNLNFATAGKWLVRNDNNDIKFRFVRTEEKKIIEPRTTEYGTLGFDGEWETAFYLVNRSALKKMAVLQKPAPKEATWYEKKNADEFTRILWDEKNQLPLSIESGKLDGTTHNKITLTLVPAPTNLPWKQLANYQTIAYEDLLD